MRKIGHSQNFIQDPKIVDTLIKSSGIDSNDLVIEIGAGHGEITKVLSKYCKGVIAVEKDQKLYRKLLDDFKVKSNVKILNTDILDFKFPGQQSYKVFSNIPFNLTSDIVRLLTEQQNLADDIFLFTQKQAAQNYLGRPQVKESLKSLFVKNYFKPSIAHRFRQSDFRPVPKVEIVLLRLEKRAKPILEEKNIKEWKDFVVFSFSQTKPNLGEGLKSIFTIKQFSQLAKDLKINFKNKPKDLSFEQWLGLYIFFSQHADQTRKNLVNDSYLKLLEQQHRLQKIHRTRVDQNWKDK